MSQRATDLWRKEALDYGATAHRGQGHVLRIYSRWTPAMYWLVLLVVAGGLAYLILGKVPEYAEGPAVVWIERTFVTSSVGGIVEEVAVKFGDDVEADDVLVRFHDAEEAAELRQIKRAFELQLINMLRDPRDEAARQALANLRTQKELAEARLEQRCVRAPHAGVVGDVRIREGQHFDVGDVLVTLSPRNAAETQPSHPLLIALLPAHYLPLLEPGMELRFEPAGHRNVIVRAEVESFQHEALGPSEIRRYLGQTLADAVPVSGPVVLLHARLDTSVFEEEQQSYEHCHGMQGLAAVRVRTERIICALVPGLKSTAAKLKTFWGQGDG